MTVKDGLLNAVADGTVVNFIANGGTLLASSCITEGGYCSVNYTPPLSFGNYTITASSYNVSSSAVIEVSKPPLRSGYYYSITNSSFASSSGNYYDGIYYQYPIITGSADISIYLVDILNESYSGATVTLSDALKYNQTCTTNNQGNCHFHYSTVNQPTFAMGNGYYGFDVYVKVNNA